MGSGHGEVTKIREAANDGGSDTGMGRGRDPDSQGEKQAEASEFQAGLCVWKGCEKPRRGLVTGTP